MFPARGCHHSHPGARLGVPHRVCRGAGVKSGVAICHIGQRELDGAVVAERHRGPSAGSQADTVAMPVRGDGKSLERQRQNISGVSRAGDSPDHADARVGLELRGHSQLSTRVDRVDGVEVAQEFRGDVSANALVHHEGAPARHGAVDIPGCRHVASGVLEAGLNDLQSVEIRVVVPEDVAI